MSQKSASVPGALPLIRFLIRNRILVIVALALTTGVFGYFLTKVRVDNDITKTVPDDLQEKIDFKTLREHFTSPRTVVLLAHFLEPMSLGQKIEAMSGWAQELSVPGVSGAPIHLGSVQVPVRGGFLGLTSRYISQPGTAQTDEELRSVLSQNRQFVGALISADEKVMCMVIQVDPSADQNAVLLEIIRLSRRIGHEGKADIHITGSPVHMYFIDQAMRKDFGILLPLCFVVIFGMLYLLFRKLLYVISCLGIILVALIWTFGIMGMTGMPFSVVSSVVPVILFPIGVAYSLHVITTFVRLRTRQGMQVEESLGVAYSQLMDALLLSSITTFVGFGSFALSRIMWTRVFGIYTGIGVLAELLLTLVLLPILLSFE